MPLEPRATFTRSEVIRRLDTLIYRIVTRTLERVGVVVPAEERQALIRDLMQQERHELDTELGWDGEEEEPGAFYP